MSGEVILKAENLVKHYPITGGRPATHRRPRQGGRRGLLRAAQGRDAGHRRRVRLRQVQPRPDADAAGGADRRQAHVRRRGRLQPEGRSDAPAAPGHPDRLPGPVHLAQPAQDRRRHHRRAVRDPPGRRAQGRPAAPGPGTARPGRAQPGAHQPLPAPVLRRPAAAHRHRPRGGAQPQGDHLRRAGVGPGRLGPGPGGQPAGEPAGRARVSRTSSSPTTCRWSGTSRTGSP